MVSILRKFVTFLGGQGICNYCGRKYPLIDSDLLELRIVYHEQLIAHFNDGSTAAVKQIKYCPMCGRRLG